MINFLSRDKSFWLKRLPLFFLIFFLLLAIPLTTYLVQQSTKTREMAASTISFQDGFETGLSNWEIQVSASSTAALSSEKVHSGTKALKIHNGGQLVIVRHNMTADHTGIVETWFYDDLASSKGTVLVVRERGDLHRIIIGINTSVYPNHYYYRLDNTPYNSQIGRTLGWHKFEVVVTQRGSYVKIDDLPVGCKSREMCNSSNYLPIHTTLKTFSVLDFVSTWGLVGDSYFDDVKVRELWAIPSSVAEREYLAVINNIVNSYGSTDFKTDLNYLEVTRFLANTAMAHAIKYKKDGNIYDFNRALELIKRVAANYSSWKNPDWQSSLRAYDFGLAAWILWDRLDSSTRQSVKNAIVSEVSYWSTQKPASGFVDDSKGEENAWSASFLALATNMFPQEAAAYQWDNAARCFAFHSITRNETYCGVTTRTVWDDFTLDNHGIHGNSDYSLATIELLGAGALTYSKTGKEIPAEFKHNVVELWNNAKGRINPVDYRFTHYDDWGANASAIWQDGALAYLSQVLGIEADYEKALTEYEFLINHDYIIYPVGKVQSISATQPVDKNNWIMNTRESHFPTLLFHDSSLSFPVTNCTSVDLATPTDQNLTATTFKMKTWEGYIDAACDQTTYHNATSSLKISSASPSNAEAYSPLIPVQPNTEYGVNYWVKINYQTTNAEAYGRLLAAEYNTFAQETDEVNVNRIRDGKATGTNLGGISDWQEKSYTFTTSSETRYLRLRTPIALWGTARGTIWFDEIKIKKTATPTPTPTSITTPTPSPTPTPPLTSTPTPTPQPPTTYIWEGSDSALRHQLGRAEGSDWWARIDMDNSGFLNYGPYYRGFAEPGRYRVIWKFLIDIHNPGFNDNVLNIDIYDATAKKLLALKQIYRNEFNADWTYQDFNLEFDYILGHEMEFRTWWHDKAYIKLDKITATKVLK